MLNNRGEVACAAAANLFWIEGGRVFTPALRLRRAGGNRGGRGCWRVAGGRRGVATGAEALDAADAVFLTNSLIGVRAVPGWASETFAPHPRWSNGWWRRSPPPFQVST
jgi:branched-subunit amino acid aminotransferase/4-amino-4-deoxychorismate lyase